MINRQNYNKTIEELEKDYWISPASFPTELVKKVYLLRKKYLPELDSNDLRILVSQNVGLKYIIPIAINKLENNIIEEAFYYPGDLLLALLESDDNYWLENKFEKEQFISVLKNSKSAILQEIDDDEIDKDILESFDKFLTNHASP